MEQWGIRPFPIIAQLCVRGDRLDPDNRDGTPGEAGWCCRGEQTWGDFSEERGKGFEAEGVERRLSFLLALLSQQ